MRRLRLIPDDTKFDFFRPMRFWLAVSLFGVLATCVLLPIRGLNYGVDFLGVDEAQVIPPRLGNPRVPCSRHSAMFDANHSQPWVVEPFEEVGDRDR